MKTLRPVLVFVLTALISSAQNRSAAWSELQNQIKPGTRVRVVCDTGVTSGKLTMGNIWPGYIACAAFLSLCDPSATSSFRSY